MADGQWHMAPPIPARRYAWTTLARPLFQCVRFSFMHHGTVSLPSSQPYQARIEPERYRRADPNFPEVFVLRVDEEVILSGYKNTGDSKNSG